jgi:predicted transcriptional regulator
MLSKKEVIKNIKLMPDTFSAEEIIERIIFINKVEEGLAESAEGKVVSTEEAKKRLKKWLK